MMRRCKMKIARIALVLLLGIIIVTGLACSEDSTKAVNSCQEAYAAQREYFDGAAQSTLANAALARCRTILTSIGTTQCGAFAEDYEENYQPLEEDELDKAYCFIIEDKVPFTEGLALAVSLGGDPRAAEILDTVAGFAEFDFMVLAEDGTVIPFNRNAMLLMSGLMR